MRPEEETYKDYLSTNYELLYDLVQKQSIICFIDKKIDSGHKWRDLCVAKSIPNFGDIYLAFMDDEGATKETYIEFCKTDNVAFINPNLLNQKNMKKEDILKKHHGIYGGINECDSLTQRTLNAMEEYAKQTWDAACKETLCKFQVLLRLIKTGAQLKETESFLGQFQRK